MRRFVDLHVHSRFSGDADYEPRALFEMAGNSELLAMAISDHDTVGAVAEGLRLAKEFGIELVPSVEISTQFNSQLYHVLAPYVDPGSPALLSALQSQLEARLDQARGRVARLQQLGFDLSFDEVAAKCGDSVPVGPAIAETLLAKPSSLTDSRLHPYLTGKKAVRRAIQFYRDFFENGQPAYMESREMNTLESFQLVREVGGVPVLAHPGAPSFGTDEATLKLFVDAGLAGLEVYSSYHDVEGTRQFLAWANQFGLVATAGSDFHGQVKPHVSFGSMKARGRELLEELQARKQR